MIRIDKCSSDLTSAVLTLPGFVTIISEEDQKYFIEWVKKERPELMK